MVQVKGIVRKGLIIIGIISVLILISRNILLKHIFNLTASKVKNAYGLTIKADALKVKGFCTFQFENFEIAGDHTFLRASVTKVKLNPFYLVMLKVNPKQVDISNAEIRADKILELFSSPQSQKTLSLKTKATPGSDKLYRLVKAFFGLSTATFNVDSMLVSYSDSSYKGDARIVNWHYNQNHFSSVIKLNDDGTTSLVEVVGKTSKRNSSVMVTALAKQPYAFIPFTSPLLGIKTSFKKIHFNIVATNIEPNRIELNFSSHIDSLWIEGKRIAQSPVTVDSCSTNLYIRVTPSCYQIDTMSSFSLNGFKANFGLRYTPIPGRRINFTLYTGQNQWQSLFDALPQGLFTNLKGIKVKGTFNYHLQVDVPLDEPDNLTINPNLTSKGFSVVSYGNTNLAMLSDTFTHRVYIDNTFIRNIKVNPKSDSYIPLGQISPYLLWAVLTSEDGGFFHHRGFSLDGITYAMASNIREGRFARGGSTISQQLVKNVFLNRSKNIGRKAEEMLITWIIENTGIVTKEKILELYLNIIEWGPNVYGINEASQYYFEKKPNTLTLPEALFLAYIIPRPTKFRYLFDSQQKLKPFVIENFIFLATKMLQRGNISQSDFDNLSLFSQVTLVGPAKNLLNNESTTDSIESEASFETMENDSW